MGVMVKETFTFSPDVKDIRKIDKIVEKIDRYGSREEFLRESIDLMITWWTDPQRVFEISAELWADYTPEMKRQIKEMSPQFYNQMENPAGGNSKDKSQLEIFAERVEKNRNFSSRHNDMLKFDVSMNARHVYATARRDGWIWICS